MGWPAQHSRGQHRQALLHSGYLRGRLRAWWKWTGRLRRLPTWPHVCMCGRVDAVGAVRGLARWLGSASAGAGRLATAARTSYRELPFRASPRLHFCQRCLFCPLHGARACWWRRTGPEPVASRAPAATHSTSAARSAAFQATGHRPPPSVSLPSLRCCAVSSRQLRDRANQPQSAMAARPSDSPRATTPARPGPAPPLGLFLFALLLALRVANALSLRSFFQPDEFFQSLEPAWQLAFGDRAGARITWVLDSPQCLPNAARVQNNLESTLTRPGMDCPSALVPASRPVRRRLPCCRQPGCPRRPQPVCPCRPARRRAPSRPGPVCCPDRLLHLAPRRKGIRPPHSHRLHHGTFNSHASCPISPAARRLIRAAAACIVSLQPLAVVLRNPDPVQLPRNRPHRRRRLPLALASH